MKQEGWDAESVKLTIWSKLVENGPGRYYQRLFAILLINEGFSRKQAADLVGASVGSVSAWVREFKKAGIDGLQEKCRKGRPTQVSEIQLQEIRQALGQPPTKFGIDGSSWSGRKLSRFILTKYSLRIGVRTCQRIIRACST